MLTVTQFDTAELASVFAKWLPREDRLSVPCQVCRPVPLSPPSQHPLDPQANGKNAANAQARAERLERCRQAVKLQIDGATRKHISVELQVSEEVVASLLRDGKFYANPTTDPKRLAAAREAAAAQKRGRTRAEFRAEMNLSRVGESGRVLERRRFLLSETAVTSDLD